MTVPGMAPPGAPAPSTSDPELQRVVSLLLATQQELIDLRYRRDREQRVLEGIVGFTEIVRPANDKQAFWDAVADSTVQTFDCESAIAIEWDGEAATVLASRGPAPVTAAELEALIQVGRDCTERRVTLVEDELVQALRFDGQPMATIMLARIDGEPREVTRLLVLSVTARKKPFFPRFDEVSVPGFRMFAATIAVLREMHRARVLIEGQVRELDAAYGELEERMAAQQRTAAEQEQLRAQLSRYRRMESLGRLAGGVAHDFNNLLTVIAGNVQVLNTDTALPEPLREVVAEMMDAAGRAQSLTQQLLMFSRKQVIRPMVVDLNRELASSLQLYRRLIGEDISLTFAPCEPETLVMADPQQFDQLISNLLLNARDAIHARGPDAAMREITVTTELVLAGSPLTDGAPAVCIAVADSGVGMEDEVRQQIFEPFFSTKEMGKGTGLGLSTVLGIVEQNGGVVRVASDVGIGSRFSVYWPLQRELERVPPAAVSAPAPRGHGKHVLLVEDDELVRTFVVRGLKRLGFTVTVCESGAAALRHFGDGATPPDILVTDVVMPHMNGRQLAEFVHARHPSLPILYVSGYTDDIIAQQGIVRDGVDLLQKPFSIDTLGTRIRQLLDARPRQA
jgi:signal transduction histidine kinase/ActR/RegA family two-component response regulator